MNINKTIYNDKIFSQNKKNGLKARYRREKISLSTLSTSC